MKSINTKECSHIRKKICMLKNDSCPFKKSTDCEKFSIVECTIAHSIRYIKKDKICNWSKICDRIDKGTYRECFGKVVDPYAK